MKSNRFLEDEYVTHLFAVVEMLRIGVGLLLKTVCLIVNFSICAQTSSSVPKILANFWPAHVVNFWQVLGV